MKRWVLKHGHLLAGALVMAGCSGGDSTGLATNAGARPGPATNTGPTACSLITLDEAKQALSGLDLKPAREDSLGNFSSCYFESVAPFGGSVTLLLRWSSLSREDFEKSAQANATGMFPVAVAPFPDVGEEAFSAGDTLLAFAKNREITVFVGFDGSTEARLAAEKPLAVIALGRL